MLAPLRGAIVITFVSRWYRPLSRTQPPANGFEPSGFAFDRCSKRSAPNSFSPRNCMSQAPWEALRVAAQKRDDPKGFAPSSPTPSCCKISRLRRYTLHMLNGNNHKIQYRFSLNKGLCVFTGPVEGVIFSHKWKRCGVAARDRSTLKHSSDHGGSERWTVDHRGNYFFFG